jgi:hypothetical protein
LQNIKYLHEQEIIVQIVSNFYILY